MIPIREQSIRKENAVKSEDSNSSVPEKALPLEEKAEEKTEELSEILMAFGQAPSKPKPTPQVTRASRGGPGWDQPQGGEHCLLLKQRYQDSWQAGPSPLPKPTSQNMSCKVIPSKASASLSTPSTTSCPKSSNKAVSSKM